MGIKYVEIIDKWIVYYKHIVWYFDTETEAKEKLKEVQDAAD